MSPAALALLIAAGPVLAFPDALPATSRVPIVTLLAVSAFGLAVYLLRDTGRLRWGLWLFLFAVIVSWTINPRDLPAVRHFGGIALGVLLMSVVARWSTTPVRTSHATIVFTALALVVLGLGLASTSVTKAKLLVGATPIETGNLFPWLPARELGLPGLEANSGRVNPNALAGTALMLLPACAGIAAAGLLAARYRRLLLGLGITSAVAAIAVLSLTRSRTALLAAALTVAVAALRWRRGRWWIASGLLALIVIVGAVAAKSRAESPEMYAQGIRFMQNSALVRVMLWEEGFEQLQTRPLFGIGLNQFRQVTPDRQLELVFDTTLHVSHAHNVFLQVALDIGVIGLAGYLMLFGTLLLHANRATRFDTVAGRIAAGAGFALVAVHLFGLGDAVALGAKVGAFQWFCAGLVLAAARVIPTAPSHRVDDVAV